MNAPATGWPSIAAVSRARSRVHRLGVLVGDRAAADRAQVAGAPALLGEPVAKPRVGVQVGRRRARHVADLEAAQPMADVGGVADLAHLAVGDEVDPGIDLVCDAVGHRGADDPIERVGVDGLAPVLRRTRDRRPPGDAAGCRRGWWGCGSRGSWPRTLLRRRARQPGCEPAAGDDPRPLVSRQLGRAGAAAPAPAPTTPRRASGTGAGSGSATPSPSGQRAGQTDPALGGAGRRGGVASAACAGREALHQVVGVDQLPARTARRPARRGPTAGRRRPASTSDSRGSRSSIRSVRGQLTAGRPEAARAEAERRERRGAALQERRAPRRARARPTARGCQPWAPSS